MAARETSSKPVPWYFEKTGPAFFNEWTVTHLGWGMLFQLVFPDRRLTGLALHTIYESIEGRIFPAEFRDTSMRNHIGDTIAFTIGMLVIPSPNERRQAPQVRGCYARASGEPPLSRGIAAPREQRALPAPGG